MLHFSIHRNLARRFKSFIRNLTAVQLAGKGVSDIEIVKKLYISEGTVKNYISDLYSKLEVND